MGGDGSGRFARRYVGTTGQALKLDVLVASKAGALTPGTAWLLRGRDGAALATLTTTETGVRVGDGASAYYLGVRAQPCRFGGSRPWWLCPTCARRCRLLYLVSGKLRCRRCSRLTFGSRREGVTDRAWRREAKAWRRLGVPDLNDRPGLDQVVKPKGMHWSTFERLREIIDASEAQRFLALEGLASRLMRRFERR